jgi:predicted Zn-dependent protease
MPERIVLDGKEIGPVIEVQEIARRGNLAAALRGANEILERDPQNRYARLERADIHQRMGQEASAARDLDYLIENHPAFNPGYVARARLFLKVRISKEGQHPLLDWLHSVDTRKQRAALEVVLEQIRQNQGSDVEQR